MITITKKNGQVNCEIYCEICGKGYAWNRNISITLIERVARNSGWKVGKNHRCNDCVANGKQVQK